MIISFPSLLLCQQTFIHYLRFFSFPLTLLREISFSLSLNLFESGFFFGEIIYQHYIFLFQAHFSRVGFKPLCIHFIWIFELQWNKLEFFFPVSSSSFILFDVHRLKYFSFSYYQNYFHIFLISFRKVPGSIPVNMGCYNKDMRLSICSCYICSWTLTSGVRVEITWY